MNKQRIILLISTVIGMSGSFLPWVSLPSEAIIGVSFHPASWVTLILFTPSLIIGIIGNRTAPLSKTKIISVITGILNIVLGILLMVAVIDTYGKDLFSYIGIGLYMIVIAGISLFIIPFLNKLFGGDTGSST